MVADLSETTPTYQDHFVKSVSSFHTVAVIDLDSGLVDVIYNDDKVQLKDVQQISDVMSVTNTILDCYKSGQIDNYPLQHYIDKDLTKLYIDFDVDLLGLESDQLATTNSVVDTTPNQQGNVINSVDNIHTDGSEFNVEQTEALTVKVNDSIDDDPSKLVRSKHINIVKQPVVNDDSGFNLDVVSEQLEPIQDVGPIDSRELLYPDSDLNPEDHTNTSMSNIDSISMAHGRDINVIQGDVMVLQEVYNEIDKMKEHIERLTTQVLQLTTQYGLIRDSI